MRLWRSRCERRGHDWFPNARGPREFIPVSDVCFRCQIRRVFLPTGRCLYNHPIAEHYDAHGERVLLESCPNGPA